jgi:O-antigen/teichoic acid export membrane protein
MASGFITVKVLAVYAGTEGMAAFGQLASAANIFMALASGAINTGVTKYIAEFSDDKIKQQVVVATAIKITVYCSVIIAVILILTADQFGNYLFKASTYNSVLRVFGLTIGLYAFNNLLISIINGVKAYKEYVIISIASSVLVMITTILLVYYLGTYGALLAFVTVQSGVIVVTLLVAKSLHFNFNIIKVPLDKPMAKLLFYYSLAALTTAIMVPLSQILTRSIIIDLISVQAAGIWEGINRISSSYLMIITTSIQVYYLPRLSQITGKKHLINEIVTTSKLVLPPLLIVTLAIFLLRDFIIALLFTEQFSSMNQLFFAQLAGDFFKIASWLVAFAMPAKAMFRQFIITEIVFSITYVVLAYVFITLWGFESISWAHCVNYFVYLLTVIVILQKSEIK